MSRGTQRAAATAAAAAAILGAAAPAHADNGRLADMDIRFLEQRPAMPSGLAVHILFHRENDPDAKPSPLRAAVVRLPDGTVIDTTALPECTASDDELRALGSEACPDDTRLTVGAFGAMTGFPNDPFIGDLHIFNGPRQIIEVVTVPGGPASPGFDRLTIEGSTLTAHPPRAAGAPPDNEASVRSLDYELPVRTADAKSFLTTPPACPRSGEWTSTGTFGFADGTTETVESRTPCARPPRPELRLTVRPKRMVAGEEARLRFRARSSAKRCIRGATVLLRGETDRTDRRGRAALTTHFHAPGPRSARITKPGCRAAHAVVRVVPAS
jgi:hypothetical protein